MLNFLGQICSNTQQCARVINIFTMLNKLATNSLWFLIIHKCKLNWLLMLAVWILKWRKMMTISFLISNFSSTHSLIYSQTYYKLQHNLIEKRYETSKTTIECNVNGAITVIATRNIWLPGSSGD